MSPEEMLAVYQRHRAAEEERDYPRVMETLTPDCFLEHVSLELRAIGQDAATKAYEELFAAFPDLGPIPEGIAFGEDVLVALGSSAGRWRARGSASTQPGARSRCRSSTSFPSETG